MLSWSTFRRPVYVGVAASVIQTAGVPKMIVEAIPSSMMVGGKDMISYFIVGALSLFIVDYMETSLSLP